jgi:hypothetical protein
MRFLREARMGRWGWSVVAGAVVATACSAHTITEDLPFTPPTPPPLQAPPPQPPPQPNPRPTATPKPDPDPTPVPDSNVAYVTAGVHSYLRGGKLYRTAAAFYLPGDAIYLNCTPRNAAGQPTDNHGPIQGWKIYSTNLKAGSDFYYTDTNSFNPDLHIELTCPPGSVKANCTVDGFTSKDHVMEVH